MDLTGVLQPFVDDGTVPGAVALVARDDGVTVTAVGHHDVGRSAPMARDSVFRWASITKPVTAAAVMMLVDDGVVALDDPVARWLPELASPRVVRSPDAAVTETVPAERAITVRHLLTGTAGYGFASDFSLPAVQALFAVQTDGREVQSRPEPDVWLAALAALPLLHQPGGAYLYDTCSDLQGILVARASGRSLPEFLAERVFGPLGMADAGFVLRSDQRARSTSYYRRDSEGRLVLGDGPDGQWSTMPAFPEGSGGLVGTVDDWHRFGRMLLAGGEVDGRRILSAGSVAGMTTNHLDAAQREAGALFLDGQGWGFGGCVDTDLREPWSSLGRYGWVGGTGTTAHVVPATRTVAILLTQVAAEDPVPPAYLREFWTATT